MHWLCIHASGLLHSDSICIPHSQNPAFHWVPYPPLLTLQVNLVAEEMGCSHLQELVHQFQMSHHRLDHPFGQQRRDCIEIRSAVLSQLQVAGFLDAFQVAWSLGAMTEWVGQQEVL